MTIRHVAISMMLLALGGCNSLDGVYEPACMALEGDRVVLQSGRFEWHKYTDERRIDDNGKVVDPFPGYPLNGSYELDGNRIEFGAESGNSIEDHYLLEQQDALYLLTAEQHREVSDGDAIPACALRRNEEDSLN